LDWRGFEAAVERWVARAKQQGATPDIPLLIHGHKEAGFFIAMAGCLCIGAPFVPVDTIYPTDRFERIKKLSGATLCYSTSGDSFESISAAPRPVDTERGLAYIIFTSGSTGEPKGVQIGREGAATLVSWMARDFKLGDAPIFMNQAPFSFDLSMYEVMGTLAMGGCCVLNDRGLAADSDRFLRRQRDAGISCWVSTPSFAYQQLVNKTFCKESIPTLDTFLFCGEPLSNALCKHLRARFPDSRIINTYGPTEATVATTWMFIDDQVLAAHDPLPVGYAKPDSQVFLDAGTGELCIAGDNVMRGYLNSPELNAGKLFEYREQRAFRTGDLGEIDAAGLIFCRGRIDDQIKLNGFRIELSEIDNALLRIAGVSSAATLALRRPNGTVARLVGVIVADPEPAEAESRRFLEACKSELGKSLPVYMLPSELILSDTPLPLSVNHKVDKKKLAELVAQRQQKTP
jgi:D-alanine--poly(phosphoribitol) ligase subunit 1